MGGASAGITFSPRPPTVILMAGLQGSGKTTATAKLARLLQGGARLVGRARRLRRLPPGRGRAAREGRASRPAPTVYEQGTDADPVEIAAWALDQARARRQGRADRRHRGPAARRPGADGGAGRHHARRMQPHSVLLVVDAMTGQDAVNVAEQFAETVAVRRRRHDEARRRRPRRRRAVDQGGHRQADPVRLAPARSSTSSSASTPTAWPSGSSAWATSSPHREGARRQFDEDEAAELERKIRKQRVHARRLPRPAEADPADGPARNPARDDAGLRRRSSSRT